MPSSALLLSILALLGVFTNVSTWAVGLPRKRATVCNGHAELCNRPYGNVTFLGSHDSFAYSEDPFALARDQEVDVTSQLNLGVRFLQAQSHVNNGVLHFCHTSCALFDGGTVQNYLTTVKKWLDANPNEVITFLFTNPESQSPENVWKPIFDAAGMTSLAYVPPNNPMKRSDWPTLGELIDSGKRVITFMDSDADGSDSVNFILPEFTMLWEPPFDSTDPSFPCSVNRISGPLATTDHLNMLNHNLDIDIFGILLSDPEEAGTTNGVASIFQDANGCAPLAGGVWPNFVMLDFVNIGQGMKAVNRLNGFSS